VIERRVASADVKVRPTAVPKNLCVFRVLRGEKL
jgi:hypothetical protein